MFDTPETFETEETKYYREYQTKLIEALIGKNGSPSLNSIIDIHFEAISSAAERKAIFPYAILAHKISGMLKRLNNKFNTYRRYNITSPGLLELIKPLADYSPKFSEVDINFERLSRYLIKTIGFKVMRNSDLDGERILLAQGSWIVPSAGSYPIIDFMYNSKRGDITFRQSVPQRFKTLEKAVQAYKSQNRLGTLAIVNHSENYPLRETVLPIVRAQYIAKFTRRQPAIF